MQSMTTGGSTDFAWQPSAELARGTNVMKFAHRHGIDDYWELVRRSQDDPEWFWAAVVEYLGIEFATPYERVMDVSQGIEWATWFVGGRINMAWNCTGRWASLTPDASAVIGETEDGVATELSYAQLWRETCRLGAGLRSLGVEPGDRVALCLPMVAEAVVALHACTLVGAVLVPIFSGLAAPAVAARLVDAEAKVVITADASLRRGKPVELKATMDDAIADAPCVRSVVVLERLGGRPLTSSSRDVLWSELVAGQPDELEPEAFDSEHPCYIGYTSGTTGRPKGAVHATGGLLVKLAEEAAFQTDLRPTDRLFWVTDLGWLMGIWEIVGANSLGGAVVVAEGAPTPPPDRIWSLCARHRVSILGVSPTLIRGLMPYGDEPVRAHDLSSLRVIASTGEPWNPEPYRWASEVVGGGRLPIINLSGGTEVGACFLSPTPAIPIKACSLGGPALGMAVDVFGPDGAPLRNEVGELVCLKPWPAMTRGVWRDPERYLEAYWSRFPGVWTHGDWALIDPDGYWFLYGRSDDTLNIAGKRIGPAEIESVLIEHPAVAESAVAGIPHEVKGEVPWCFCVLVPGVEPTDELSKEISLLVVDHLGKSFAPDRILFVPALPKTRSAKIVRRALRAAATNEDAGDLSSLEEPDVLVAIHEAIARGN
jgi:acetyl-CoA synthetase